MKQKRERRDMTGRRKKNSLLQVLSMETLTATVYFELLSGNKK